MSREVMMDVCDQIMVLNQKKDPWQKFWKKECETDPLSPKPVELKAINRELVDLYQRKERLLAAEPSLATEFGAMRKGKKRDDERRLVGPSRGMVLAADRQARKKLMHPEFKQWCSEQRPQVKASLENWEDELVQNRFREQFPMTMDEVADTVTADVAAMKGE